jgi:hypothetical protein
MMNSIYRIKNCSIIAPLVFFFVACTDYQANYESKYDSMFVEAEETFEIPEYKSKSDLPECSLTEGLGQVAMLKKDSSFYVCIGGEWSQKNGILKVEDELPNCTETREGWTYYIDQEQEVYQCESRRWIVGEAVNPFIEGSFVDTRDGKKYKTVQVEDKVWFAENLNYDDGESTCLDDSDSLCARYGRSYSLASIANMKLGDDDDYLENGYSGLIELCPAGWHVPYESDWSALNEVLAKSRVKNVAGLLDLEENNPVFWGVSSFIVASLRTLAYGYKLSAEEGSFAVDKNADYSMQSAVRCVKGEVVTNCKCGAAKLRSSSNMVSEGKPVEFEWTVKGCKGGKEFTYQWEDSKVSSEGNKGRLKITEAGDYADFTKVFVTNEKGASTQVICGAYPYTLNVMAR